MAAREAARGGGALTQYEGRVLDDVVSVLCACERFAFDLGDAPAEETPLPDAAPPPDACSRREARARDATQRHR
jgi:hypothetical protein